MILSTGINRYILAKELNAFTNPTWLRLQCGTQQSADDKGEISSDEYPEIAAHFCLITASPLHNSTGETSFRVHEVSFALLHNDFCCLYLFAEEYKQTASHYQSSTNQRQYIRHITEDNIADDNRPYELQIVERLNHCKRRKA